MQTQTLIEKINKLPVEKIPEVEDFVDFLQLKSKREIEKSRFDAISKYAEQNAESDADLDEDLEQAGLEFLTKDESR